MVACIAVESLSILEQLHLRGYCKRIFSHLSVNSYYSWICDWRLIIPFYQFCSRRCKARKLFTWSARDTQWEKVVFVWSRFMYMFLLFLIRFVFQICFIRGQKLIEYPFQLQNGGIRVRVIMLIMTKSLMCSGNSQ